MPEVNISAARRVTSARAGGSAVSPLAASATASRGAVRQALNAHAAEDHGQRTSARPAGDQ
jgi:hypothetical protein